MKKLFLYVFLSLFFYNIVVASAWAGRNINLALRCYHSGVALLTLDVFGDMDVADKNTTGYILAHNTYDGSKTPEFTLVITANEKDYNIWEGEIIYVATNNKAKFNLAMIKIDDKDISELHGVRYYKKDGGIKILKLRSTKTFHTEEIYYELDYIDVFNTNVLKNKKKIIADMNKDYFGSDVWTYFCFK